jgi:predicted GNAT superfamily acetyltransferase
LLYQSVEQHMLDSAEYSLLCCEVNLEPPNLGSIRFHKRIGFVECGVESTAPGYAVAYLQKFLT